MHWKKAAVPTLHSLQDWISTLPSHIYTTLIWWLIRLAWYFPFVLLFHILIQETILFISYLSEVTFSSTVASYGSFLSMDAGRRFQGALGLHYGVRPFILNCLFKIYMQIAIILFLLHNKKEFMNNS